MKELRVVILKTITEHQHADNVGNGRVHGCSDVERLAFLGEEENVT
uniref:Uncharacterized protein n=1 Tax=Anguilla anguilla TaxID=7936 RepID=A0A0E9TEP8_ANGAN